MSTIQLKIHEQVITIHIQRQAYRRSIKLQFRTQDFVVTAPVGLSTPQIEDFIHTQSQWIIKRLNQQKNKAILPELPFTIETKRAAKCLVLSLIEQYSSLYPFSYKKITIKNLQSKWGSCSAQKNLNFNYRIIALPSHLAAYLVVHELCHLKELNHSQRFWNLVSQTFPHHQAVRKELHNIDFKKID